MIHLVPGDPVRAALGPTAPASLVAARKAALGLDKPLVTQYVDYVRNVLHGDFGTSLTTGESVTEVIQQRGAGHAQARRASRSSSRSSSRCRSAC